MLAAQPPASLRRPPLMLLRPVPDGPGASQDALGPVATVTGPREAEVLAAPPRRLAPASGTQLSAVEVPW